MFFLVKMLWLCSKRRQTLRFPGFFKADFDLTNFLVKVLRLCSNKTRNSSSLKARVWIFLNRLNLFEFFCIVWIFLNRFNLFKSIWTISTYLNLFQSFWIYFKLIWIYFNWLNVFEVKWFLLIEVSRKREIKPGWKCR